MIYPHTLRINWETISVGNMKDREGFPSQIIDYQKQILSYNAYIYFNINVISFSIMIIVP